MPEFNGTTYHDDTAPEVIRIIEHALRHGYRIRVHYGYTVDETRDGVHHPAGSDWLEENDVTGYVGRSMGPTRVPLLAYNRRSNGGGGILTRCVVRIRHTDKGRRDLYRHPAYVVPRAEVRPAVLVESRTYRAAVLVDGIIHARFERPDSAPRWVAKMGLDLASSAPAFAGGVVRAIARGILADQAWDRCPVLADALEDAGYTTPTDLAALRDGRPATARVRLSIVAQIDGVGSPAA